MDIFVSRVEREWLRTVVSRALMRLCGEMYSSMLLSHSILKCWGIGGNKTELVL